MKTMLALLVAATIPQLAHAEGPKVTPVQFELSNDEISAIQALLTLNAQTRREAQRIERSTGNRPQQLTHKGTAKIGGATRAMESLKVRSGEIAGYVKLPKAIVRLSEMPGLRRMAYLQPRGEGVKGPAKSLNLSNGAATRGTVPVVGMTRAQLKRVGLYRKPLRQHVRR